VGVLPTGTLARVLLSIALLSAATACQPAAPPSLYTGPTEPLHAVVDHINANSAQVPTLWAAVKYFEGNFVDDSNHSQFVNGNGALNYRATGEFLFQGVKEGADIFNIGCNTDRYWLKIYPNPPSTMWWGQFANLGKPGVQNLPVRPDLIRDVLGLSAIGPDLVSPPVPVMRFNNDARAYMFVWSIPKDDHWIPQREIWYDMTTFRPRRVLLFDSEGMGRVVLKADLSDPIAVAVPDQPKSQWPIIAGTYNLFFPDSGSTLMFQLDQAALSHKAPGGTMAAPNDFTFKFKIEPDFNKVIQLDAAVQK
jgi:hypothetical protein